MIFVIWVRIIIGAIVTVVVGILLTATGWNFKAVAEMPEKYVLKEDQRIFIENNDKEHQRILDKLDKIIEHLLEEKHHE